MIRRPRDLTELECLYDDEARPACRAYLEEAMDQKVVVYRFQESGIEATDQDLRKKAAGDTLAALARQHMERKGGSFSDALRIVMSICPGETRAYFRQ